MKIDEEMMFFSIIPEKGENIEEILDLIPPEDRFYSADKRQWLIRRKHRNIFDRIVQKKQTRLF